MIINYIEKFLIDLDLIDKSSIVMIQDGVRDNKNIKVYKCNRSGIIFLSGDDHIGDEYYASLEGFSYWGDDNMEKALGETYRDDHRRFQFLKDLIKDKICLDFGAGNGGFMRLALSTAKIIYGTELQEAVLNKLRDEGLRVESNVDNYEKDFFDVVTMFHILEHLKNPIGIFEKIYSRMKVDGKIVVEVPHARDFLLSFLQNESFMRFTFWSEHLILHTEESLTRILEKCGFRNIHIHRIQRYPMSNHLYWLVHEESGGHVRWADLTDQDFDQAYEKLLGSKNMTDTLLAVAQK